MVKCGFNDERIPELSPFRFGFNNHLRFSDPNGDFEINEDTAATYPKFNVYLQNLAALFKIFLTSKSMVASFPDPIWRGHRPVLTIRGGTTWG
jgi:hypothetical protein